MTYIPIEDYTGDTLDELFRASPKLRELLQEMQLLGYRISFGKNGGIYLTKNIK